MADYIKYEDDEKKKGESGSWFSFKVFFLALILFFIISSIISSITYSMTPKLAIVPIKGPIMTEADASLLYGSSLSSRDIAQTLKELEDDDSVKAVILDINSPGGSPVASEEISRAVESLKKKKPVYALINDVGASGAFWVAVSANETYASSMSVVGSIGVTSAGLGFEQFIKEWNITYRQQTAGKYKDMGSPFKEPTAEEENMTQAILDEIHTNFIHHVAVSRHLDEAYVRNFSEGQIFLGSQAKDIGFIDHIGYMPDVQADIEAKEGELMVVDYGPDPSFLELLGVKSTELTPKSQVMLQ